MIPSSTLFLSATDTTIGFLSQDPRLLDRAKQRPPTKHYITVYPSLTIMKRDFRLPSGMRRRVRQSRRTTFIHPGGESFRIIRDPRHCLLLERLGWAYSSSANLSGRSFDEAYARSVADIIVEPLGAPGLPSAILKIGRKRIRRIR